MRRPTTLAAVVLAAVVSLVGGACGIPNDDEPRTLSVGRIPYGLLDDAPVTTTSIPTPSVPKASVFVYFVRADRMVPVVRNVNAPATVAKSLTALLFGPQENEAMEGLRSAINPTAGVQARSLDPSTYLVDLSTEFVQGSTSEQVLGLAQIVYTATGIAGVTGVRFSLNGAPIEVPTPTGLTSDPVSRETFGGFAPLPPTVNLPS